MAIEPERVQKRLRILSGTVEEIEFELNQMLDDYAVTVWNITPGTECVIVTVVLIAVSELRKAALMQGRAR